MIEAEQHELLKMVAAGLDGLRRDMKQLDDKVAAGLDGLRRELRRDMKQLDDKFERERGTYGRESSIKFTIVLCIERDGRVSTLGHGILIKAGEQFFVQTAAHVALSFRQYQESSFQLKVRFLSTGKVLACNSDDLKLFFRAEYVTEGTDDIAFISTSFNKEDIDTFEAVPLGIEQRNAFDTDFFGRTLDVRFKSHAFVNSHRRRVALATPSKPGCSGAPLFSDDGKLLAVLHGATKHRCKTKHSPSNHGHHGAGNSDDMENMSTFVYVDMVQGVRSVEFWDNKYTFCLMHLEFLKTAETENPSKKLQYSCSEENPSCDEGASRDANKFFEKATAILESGSKPTEGSSFSISDICQRIVEHHRASTRDPNHNSLAEKLCQTLEANTLFAITVKDMDEGTPPVAALQSASGDDRRES